MRGVLCTVFVWLRLDSREQFPGCTWSRIFFYTRVERTDKTLLPMEHWLYLNTQQYYNPNWSYCMQWCSHGRGVCAANTRKHLCVCVWHSQMESAVIQYSWLFIPTLDTLCSHVHTSVWMTLDTGVCAAFWDRYKGLRESSTMQQHISRESVNRMVRVEKLRAGTLLRWEGNLHLLVVLGVINILKRWDGHAHNSTPPLWKKERSWKGMYRREDGNKSRSKKKQCKTAATSLERNRTAQVTET